MISRIIKLPGTGSFFLFGPRQTGKSTLVQSLYTKGVWKIDFLLTDIFLKYSKDPALFRREAEEKIAHEDINTIFVDEIQRVPVLLNEIHYLIEKYSDCRFILTGSSARKLKRSGANLLAGRAVERFLFPFTFAETDSGFELDDALIYGTLPVVFGKNKDEKRDILEAYSHVYLREEIQQEGVVRNLGGFSRFLDVAAAQFGEQISFSAIARDCALPVRTVQSYYEILDDTLVGFRLEPWRRSVRKRLSGHPKYYFFDNGVTNAINRQLTGQMDRSVIGRLFEQFIVLETYRYLSYMRSEARLFYWRTGHGAEVDLIVEKHNRIKFAVEIKSTETVSGAHCSGLRAFREEYSDVPCFIVCRAENSYNLDGFHVIGWQKYLKKLNELVE
jgi:uncharacterized protein